MDLPTRLARWNHLLGYIWVPGVVLFLIAAIFKLRIPMLTSGYWLFVLLTVVAVLVAVRDYRPARTLLFAMVPFVVYKTLEYTLTGADGKLAKRFDDALDTSQGFVIIWLITFIFIARSQKKPWKKSGCSARKKKRPSA
ncbi:hypothetical protein ACFQT0_06905 [Hymenobacter humi]|uniref:Transmembrane protein n=1 Tax=Hymenobacter humi TaxID=1411620 RepID=A0ABW2U155_9BACT